MKDIRVKAVEKAFDTLSSMHSREAVGSETFDGDAVLDVMLKTIENGADWYEDIRQVAQWLDEDREFLGFWTDKVKETARFQKFLSEKRLRETVAFERKALRAKRLRSALSYVAETTDKGPQDQAERYSGPDAEHWMAEDRQNAMKRAEDRLASSGVFDDRLRHRTDFGGQWRSISEWKDLFVGKHFEDDPVFRIPYMSERQMRRRIAAIQPDLDALGLRIPNAGKNNADLYHALILHYVFSIPMMDIMDFIYSDLDEFIFARSSSSRLLSLFNQIVCTRKYLQSLEDEYERTCPPGWLSLRDLRKMIREGRDHEG